MNISYSDTFSSLLWVMQEKHSLLHFKIEPARTARAYAKWYGEYYHIIINTCWYTIVPCGVYVFRLSGHLIKFCEFVSGVALLFSQNLRKNVIIFLRRRLSKRSWSQSTTIVKYFIIYKMKAWNNNYKSDLIHDR